MAKTKMNKTMRQSITTTLLAVLMSMVGITAKAQASQYLTFVARENVSFSFNGTLSNDVDNFMIYYSLDNGDSWTPLRRNVQSPTVLVGNRIMFSGTCIPFYYYEKGSEAIIGIGNFSSTGRFDVEGNVMSLVCGSGFFGENDLRGKDYAFYDLFANCTGLISAENLALPATILSKSCYEGMFRSCTSMTKAPQLPATTLEKGCYAGMFYDCTSLSVAPQLPATTLSVNCYANMFGGCKSLTTAPQLPAATLVDQCYRYMFDGCTKLQEITCLATNNYASDCTYNWVRNVPSTGTFIKASNMNSWTNGSDGIPSNWSVLNYNQDNTSDGILYKMKDDGTLEVTGAEDGVTLVDIPFIATLNGNKYYVTSIAKMAFIGRSDITYLSIPYSIESIGEYAFIDCGSSITVNIADPESWCKMKLGNEHACPLSSAGRMLVYDRETDRIDIPSSVTSVGAFTFYQCSCIKSLNIPGTVTSIGSSAFEDCDYLTSLTLGEGLQSIGGSAFEGCVSLTTLVIPSTVNSIKLNAFKDCSGLTDVYCNAAILPNTDASAFDGVGIENVMLHVPANAVEAYRITWPWSGFKEIVTDEDGIMGVKQSNDDNYQYYNLAGRKDYRPQKGLNIIRHKDGTKKKIMIK